MDSRVGDGETAAVTARENLKQRLGAFLSLARELFASTAHAAGAEQPARQRQLRPPTEVMAALIANDTAMVTACGELEQMTQFELKVRRFKAQIKAEEKLVATLLGVLKKAEARLFDAIAAAKPLVAAHRAAEAQPVELDELMYVARNVSYTTRSRPGFQPGMLMQGFLRPYPLPAEMCSGMPPLVAHLPPRTRRFVCLCVMTRRAFVWGAGWLMHECITAAAPAAATDAAQPAAGAAAAAGGEGAALARQISSGAAGAGAAGAAAAAAGGRKRGREAEGPDSAAGTEDAAPTAKRRAVPAQGADTPAPPAAAAAAASGGRVGGASGGAEAAAAESSSEEEEDDADDLEWE